MSDIDPKKIGGHLRMSVESTYGTAASPTRWFPLFGGVEQASAEDRERWARERAGAMVWTARFVGALAAIVDPLSRKVLALHGVREEYGGRACSGCDFAGYEAEAPEWPCRTVALIAEHHGITVPERIEFP